MATNYKLLIDIDNEIFEPQIVHGLSDADHHIKLREAWAHENAKRLRTYTIVVEAVVEEAVVLPAETANAPVELGNVAPEAPEAPQAA